MIKVCVFRADTTFKLNEHAVNCRMFTAVDVNSFIIIIEVITDLKGNLYTN